MLPDLLSVLDYGREALQAENNSNKLQILIIWSGKLK
jgi:hypothetical protein